MSPDAWTDLGAFVLAAARFITAIWLFALVVRMLWSMLVKLRPGLPGIRSVTPSRQPESDLARVVAGSGDGGFYASIVAGRLRGILRDKLRLERGLSDAEAARELRAGLSGLPEQLSACIFEDSLEKKPDEHFIDAASALLDALDGQDGVGANKDVP